MTSDRADIHRWDPELSNAETYFIGLIFVHWASLEHEVFVQTLMTFDPENGPSPPLPKEMNNLQFSGVLELWKERVVDATPSRRGKVLSRQYADICKLKEGRDAIAHGMWHWSSEDLGRINSVRIRKRDIITAHFSKEFLAEFADKLASINFKIRFPGGLTDFAKIQLDQGGYISRRALAMFAGAPVDEEGLQSEKGSGGHRLPKQTDA